MKFLRSMDRKVRISLTINLFIGKTVTLEKSAELSEL